MDTMKNREVASKKIVQKVRTDTRPITTAQNKVPKRDDNLSALSALKSQPKASVFDKPASADSAPKDSTAPKLDDRQRNSIRLALGMFSAIVVLVVLVLVVVGVGVYKWGWNNSFTDKVIGIIPYPAIVFDSHVLTYENFKEDVKTLDFFYTSQQEKSTDTYKRPTNAFLEKSVLTRMVREDFMKSAAEDFGISVSQQEIDDQYNTIASQAGGDEGMKGMLLDYYNMTPDQFKTKAIFPYLLQTKIQEHIADDETLNAEARSKAEAASQKIMNKEATFDELYAEFENDSSAIVQDLGYFTKEEMPTEIIDAIANLEKDQTTGVVKTAYGYHLVKVTDRIAATDTEEEQIKASHILFPSVALDDWMNEKMADKKVTIFVSGYEFKSSCGLILASAETCEKNELIDFSASTASDITAQ
ncbi:MAG: peptidylprolyl isomerase [Patescibacteria group bacterium]|nr:peptidylprolyl isomerase [Patescibacteria group bacterium]MDD5715999.1 peptidylprolyl isomerase [Patescibacteria group bacterium]